MQKTKKRVICLLLSALVVLLTFAPAAAFAVESDVGKILVEAYALAENEKLTYDTTLIGNVISVNTPYSAQYNNITVTMEIPGYASMPIVCYRLKGAGIETLNIGDTITVTGRLHNYYGTIEFDTGCTLNNLVTGNNGVSTPPEDSVEIVDAAYALDPGASLPYTVSITGKITSIDTPYDSSYKNITVTIIVSGRADKPIKCFRLKGDGAENLKVGDTITVTGVIRNYQNSSGDCEIKFNSGCTFVYTCIHSYEHTVISATCTKGSYEAMVCTICGYIDPDSVSEEITPPLSHSYITTVVAPTCTKGGYTVHSCSHCGASYTGGTTPAIGHSFSEFVPDGNATCTTDGTKTAICCLCGIESTAVDESSALGHSFTIYLDDQNALCRQDGTKTAKCDRCAATDTVTIPGTAFGHEYTDGICSRCGQKKPTRLLGDLTGDDKLNIGDVATLYALVCGSNLTVDEALLAYADITGDNRLNVGDVARLYAHIRGTIPLS